MEETSQPKPVMVSRLPKFGSRPESGSIPQTNGSHCPASGTGIKDAPPKRPNGMVRLPEEGAVTTQALRELGATASPNKPLLNGFTRICTPGKAGSSLPRPRANSGSAHNQSDQFPESIVRSQSFTHSNQLPPGQHVKRSFSFTRALEVARPLPDTQLRTRAPLLKPTTTSAVPIADKGRQGLPTKQAPPPSHLKKPLLPNAALRKPTTLGYRFACPTPSHQPRPLLQVSLASLDTPPVTPDPESDSENPRLCEDVEAGGSPGDGLEDMSLSSLSSLEHNNTSEDLLEDLDTDPSQLQDDGERTRKNENLHCLLPEDGSWPGVGLEGNPFSMSPEVDIPNASPLELSPSNSSGATYMWDEEGLEVLGKPTHPIGSCDSDVNSTDVLNNLDYCDLEDDDLMLDLDHPEDLSLHSDADGMSHSDRSARGGRQGRWRRRPHQWVGADSFHNDNRGADLPQLVGHSIPGHKLGGHHDGLTATLDDMILKHMAQDCSSVKSQLIKLRNLLQMDDGGQIHEAVGSVLSPDTSEDSNISLQAEELMQEVLELREELKNKERTIAQLTHRMTAQPHAPRCQCQVRAPARGERRTQHDKATQTPWKAHGGVVPAPFLSPWQGPQQGAPRACGPHRRQTSTTTVFQSLSQRAAQPGKINKNTLYRGPQ